MEKWLEWLTMVVSMRWDYVFVLLFIFKSIPDTCNIFESERRGPNACSRLPSKNKNPRKFPLEPHLRAGPREGWGCSAAPSSGETGSSCHCQLGPPPQMGGGVQVHTSPQEITKFLFFKEKPNEYSSTSKDTFWEDWVLTGRHFREAQICKFI